MNKNQNNKEEEKIQNTFYYEPFFMFVTPNSNKLPKLNKY